MVQDKQPALPGVGPEAGSACCSSALWSQLCGWFWVFFFHFSGGTIARPVPTPMTCFFLDVDESKLRLRPDLLPIIPFCVFASNCSR